MLNANAPFELSETKPAQIASSVKLSCFIVKCFLWGPAGAGGLQGSWRLSGSSARNRNNIMYGFVDVLCHGLVSRRGLQASSIWICPVT